MNVFIIGRKYEGKTTLGVFLARRVRDEKHGYKVIVFEPKWTLRSIPHTDDIHEFSDMLNDSELNEVTFYAGSGVAEDESKDADSKIVRQDFTDFYDRAGIESFLRNPPARPLVVVIDEAYYLQGNGYVHPRLARMMRLASEGKLYIFMMVHRPIDLDPDVRGKADQFFFFNEFEPLDLKVIREMCGADCADTVARLPEHHVLSFKVRGREVKLWNHPELWYTDTSEEANVERDIESVT